MTPSKTVSPNSIPSNVSHYYPAMNFKTEEQIRSENRCADMSCTCQKPNGLVHCPAHNDEYPSCSVSTMSNGKVTWHCHANCSQQEVTQAILDRQTIKPQPTHNVPLPVAPAQKICPDEAEAILFQRGLSRSTLQKFQIVADVNKQAWEYPVVAEGQIRAVRYKSFPGQRNNKYWWPAKKGDSRRYFVYGTSGLASNLEELYLVAGEPDVWIMQQLGYSAVSFLGGEGAVKPEYFKELKRLFPNLQIIKVVYDDDAAGMSGAQKAIEIGTQNGFAVSATNLSGLNTTRKAGFDLSDLYTLQNGDDTLFKRTVNSLTFNATTPSTQISTTNAHQSYACTDTGNAERFIAQWGQEYCACNTLGQYIWNGKCWESDTNNKLHEWGKRTIRSIRQEAKLAPDENSSSIISWAAKSESAAKRNSMIELAIKDGPKVNASDFDQKRMLFNVQNGTIDLETGRLLSHDRAHRLTLISPTSYDASAKCSEFLSFISKIVDGDEELIHFLQLFIGYTLTGLTNEQCFLILWGGGSNGKSTLLHIISQLLGTYHKHAANSTFMQNRFGAGVPNDLAMLRAARMVSASETNEGRQLDEGKIKEMTGGDPVTARFLNKEFFEYIPEFKLYLATNHKPTIKGTDTGIWRRVRLLPFQVQFWNPDRQGENGPEYLRADKQLKEKLILELPGILNWAIEGCLQWQKNGLPNASLIANATQDYRNDSDPLERFLTHKCNQSIGCKVANMELFQSYREWAKQEGETEFTQTAFSQQLKAKGFENKRGSGGLTVWKGIGLISYENDRPA